MIQKGVNFSSSSSSSFLCLSASTHGKFMTNLTDELDCRFYDLTEYEITLGQRHQDLKQHFNTWRAWSRVCRKLVGHIGSYIFSQNMTVVVLRF